MDPRVSLLKEFYRGLPRDRAKLETEEHGFAFVERLLTDGVTLEYGELTPFGLVHKYKLACIPERRMDDFLLAHVENVCNICLYFDVCANDTFCFNLDNNHQVNSSEIIPEMDLAVRELGGHLRAWSANRWSWPVAAAITSGAGWKPRLPTSASLTSCCAPGARLRRRFIARGTTIIR